MYKQYKDKSEWFVVYIREAHPADGWQVNANVKAGIEIDQPKTMEERIDVASECVREMKLSIPAIIDGMDNKVGEDYAGWPDRLYIVDKAGKIAYRGGKGPGGFKPLEMEEALKKILKL